MTTISKSITMSSFTLEDTARDADGDDPVFALPYRHRPLVPIAFLRDVHRQRTDGPVQAEFAENAPLVHGKLLDVTE